MQRYPTLYQWFNLGIKLKIFKYCDLRLQILFNISHSFCSQLNSLKYCYILTFWPGLKCHSKVMHRKEVTHSNGSYERKSRGRKLADEMGRAKKFPWYTHRLMHCELHDSYFRLMTIKHSISAIEWALNYYITQSRRKSRASCSRVGNGVRRDVVGKATPGRGGTREPWLNWGPEKMLISAVKKASTQQSGPLDLRLSIRRTRKTQRDGHKSRGHNIAVMFDLQLPLTRKPWVNLFEPLQ